jgi:hypothetical protein
MEKKKINNIHLVVIGVLWVVTFVAFFVFGLTFNEILKSKEYVKLENKIHIGLCLILALIIFSSVIYSSYFFFVMSAVISGIFTLIAIMINYFIYNFLK